MWKTPLIAAAAVIGSVGLASAQMDHSGHSDAMPHAHQLQDQAVAPAALSEPGQGAFAAIAEVVRVLEADPDTDWSRVDIGGLRAHLVDMDRLVSDTVVVETALDDGLVARATGDTETVAALRRMVLAHAPQLAQDSRWQVEAAETDDGVMLQVTSARPDVAARIKGLGFFGLMASQDHHRDHHLAMARGDEVHGH